MRSSTGNWAGGDDVFPELAVQRMGRDRVIADPAPEGRAWEPVWFDNPVGQRMEAQYKATLLNEKAGNSSQRLVYLNKLVQTHQRAGSEANDGSAGRSCPP